MKTIMIVVSVMCVLLSGCASTGKAVVQEGDDLVRLYGDDVAKLFAKYGDDIARTSVEYADDVGRQTQYSDEAARYWDDIARSVQAAQPYEDEALRLLYRDEALSPLQANVVRRLRQEAMMSDEESLLYLQSVCSVASYVQFIGDYPDQSYTQFYVEQVAAQNGILIFSVADFTQSVVENTRKLIEESGPTPQEGAKLLFDGLCLVSDVLEK